MKKTAVEDCLILDVNRVMSSDIFNAQREVHLLLKRNMVYIADAVLTPGIDYQISWSMYLKYSIGLKDIGCPITIEITYGRHNQKWFWFLCPAVINGTACRKRVKKLYLPPNSDLFACRHCHDLSYLSRQCWSKRKEAIQGFWKRVRGILKDG